MSFSRLYVYHLQNSCLHVTNASLQETDKAVIDVEAQEDGILAKVVVCNDLTVVLALPCSRIHVIGFRRIEERRRR